MIPLNSGPRPKMNIDAITFNPETSFTEGSAGTITVNLVDPHASCTAEIVWGARQIGEVVPGGVGSGLYGIVVFAIIAMFVAGVASGIVWWPGPDQASTTPGRWNGA